MGNNTYLADRGGAWDLASRLLFSPARLSFPLAGRDAPPVKGCATNRARAVVARLTYLVGGRGGGGGAGLVIEPPAAVCRGVGSEAGGCCRLNGCSDMLTDPATVNGQSFYPSCGFRSRQDDQRL